MCGCTRTGLIDHWLEVGFRSHLAPGVHHNTGKRINKSTPETLEFLEFELLHGHSVDRKGPSILISTPVARHELARDQPGVGLELSRLYLKLDLPVEEYIKYLLASIMENISFIGH